MRLAASCDDGIQLGWLGQNWPLLMVNCDETVPASDAPVVKIPGHCRVRALVPNALIIAALPQPPLGRTVRLCWHA